jgi:hypothetical protein
MAEHNPSSTWKKEILRRHMEINVQEVMRDMEAKGRSVTRAGAVRIVRCGTIERVARLWAEEHERAPLSVAEFRALMAAFNEVMDEMATAGESSNG